MQVNKTLSLNLDLLRQVDEVRPVGKNFSALVEDLLNDWLKKTAKKKGK